MIFCIIRTGHLIGVEVPAINLELTLELHPEISAARIQNILTAMEEELSEKTGRSLCGIINALARFDAPFTLTIDIPDAR